MRTARRQRESFSTWAFWVFGVALGTISLLSGQEPAPIPWPAVPSAQHEDRPLPINLPTALQLANAAPLDVALASQRLEAAAAQLAHTRILWLPTIYVGADYARQDGRIQDIQGNVFDTSRQSLMAGA